MSQASRPSIRMLIVLLALLPVIGRTAEPKPRPERWATPMDQPGLPNLHKLNDGLYRGAQPTAEGMIELEKLGIKTVVSLRWRHADDEILGDTELTLERIPLKTWNVREDDVVRFLRIVTDEERQPVFVHCQHGADRTGTMCAAYRVVVDGWSKQQAIEEMTEGGFEFHSLWTNLPEMIEHLDASRIKKKMASREKPAK